MSYLERSVTPKLLKMMDAFPCVVVSGARQVGKSTLIQHLFPRMDYVVFDPSTDIQNARQDPDLFLDSHPGPLMLDEIQFAPEVVSAIKRRIDRDRKPGQYILTGSQQWQVIKNLSESLAGRAVFVDLNGFSLSEMCRYSGQGWICRFLENPTHFMSLPSDVFKLDRSVFETVWRGFLPEATFLEEDMVSVFYEGYLRTYIERDARVLADVSDWHEFSRFIGLCAGLTGQEINFSQLGRELGMLPQTAKRWLHTLKATYQWMELPAFSNNQIKKVTQKSKGYLTNSGMAAFLLGISKPQNLMAHPYAGHLFESAVVMDIVKQLGSFSRMPELFHWRSRTGAEVDLVIVHDQTFFPIEIKLKTHPTKRDGSGIDAFRKTYSHLNVGPGLIICSAETRYPLSQDTFVVPWHSK